VAEDEKLVPFWRLAVDAVVDLGVGAAETDAKHLHRDLVGFHLRIRHVAHVDRVLGPGPYDDGFHGVLI
jgi:hypothetical protein